MSTDIELSKPQLTKLIESGGFLGKTLISKNCNLGKKALIDLALPLAYGILPKLTTKSNCPS